MWSRNTVTKGNRRAKTNNQCIRTGLPLNVFDNLKIQMKWSSWHLCCIRTAIVSENAFKSLMRKKKSYSRL